MSLPRSVNFLPIICHLPRSDERRPREVEEEREALGADWLHRRLGSLQLPVRFKQLFLGAVIVAQLTAWSIPIPEDPGSILVIGNFYWTIIDC